MSGKARRSSAQLTTQVSNHHLTVGDGASALARLYDELYQLRESTDGGTLIWELIGKHLAAYEVREEVREAGKKLSAVKREAIVRAAAQEYEARLAYQNLRAKDIISRANMSNLVRLAVDFAKDVDRVLSDPQNANLPDHLKIELAEQLITRGLERIMTGGGEAGSPRLLSSGKRSPTIIEPDEF